MKNAKLLKSIFYVKFLTGKPDNSIGYNYRRLIDNVPTGIYECNTGCKCKSTCLNRVAQVNIVRSALSLSY